MRVFVKPTYFLFLYVFWYNAWVQGDRKTARKINDLLKDIERNGHEGIGKPEPLRHDLSGYWSRRITQVDRLIYTFDEKNIGGIADKMKSVRLA